MTAADRPSVTDNARAALDRITDLFEKWAAEEDEHRQASAYGIAEGLRIAIEDLREAVHGALDKAATALAAARAIRAWSGQVRAELDATRAHGIALGEGYLHGVYSALQQADDHAARLLNDAEWAAGRAETTTATTEQAARVLRSHTDMTDRSARDGCECGHLGPHHVHQAEVLAAAGLLARPTPSRDDTPTPTIRYATLTDGTVELDEVVADNASVHLEKMDTASWWLGIDVAGTHLAVNLGVDEDGNEFAHADPAVGKVNATLDGKPIQGGTDE